MRSVIHLTGELHTTCDEMARKTALFEKTFDVEVHLPEVDGP